MVDDNTYTNERGGVNLLTATPNGAVGTRVWWCTVENNTFNNVSIVDNADPYDDNRAGPQILADVWRDNTINTAPDAVFDEGSKGSTTATPTRS